MTDGIVFNTRRPPFDRLETRRAVSNAIDRRELVEGYIYGFGTPADGSGAADCAELSSGDCGGPSPSTRCSRPGRIDFELLTVGSGEAPLEQMLQARLRTRRIRCGHPPAGAVRFPRPGIRSRPTSRPPCSAPRVISAWAISVPWPHWPASTHPFRSGAAQRMFADSMPVAFLYHATRPSGHESTGAWGHHGSAGGAAHRS